MTTSCLFAGKWKISAAFVRNDPIEKASVNTKAICKHVRSQSCFAALKTWCSQFSEGEKVTPVLRETEKKNKTCQQQMEAVRTKIQHARSLCPDSFPLCAPKAGWNRARTSGEPSGLVNTLIRYCFEGSWGKEREERSLSATHTYSLKVPLRFCCFFFSFLFFWSPPFYNCAYFPLWIMCFGFE